MCTFVHDSYVLMSDQLTLDTDGTSIGGIFMAKKILDYHKRHKNTCLTAKIIYQNNETKI